MARSGNLLTGLTIIGVFGVVAYGVSRAYGTDLGLPDLGFLPRFSAPVTRIQFPAAPGIISAPGNLKPRSTVLLDLTTAKPRTSWTQWQKDNEAKILSLFRAAGYSTNVARAAVANAAVESGLDHLAIGDNGNSVGLFQLNIKGGGAGMSVPARQDPDQHIARILEILKGGGDKNIVAADKSGQPVPALAALFARDIERCAECGVKPGRDSELRRRAAVARSLFA
jgi:hypothetical protein